jgi:hypothetical protein
MTIAATLICPPLVAHVTDIKKSRQVKLVIYKAVLEEQTLRRKCVAARSDTEERRAINVVLALQSLTRGVLDLAKIVEQFRDMTEVVAVWSDGKA